jgi:hypothetical protein
VWEGVDIVQILFIYVCKWTNDSTETIPAKGRRRDKGEWWVSIQI